MALGDLIQKSGKTLVEISRESEISMSHISRLADGLRRPSVGTCIKLAETLGVSVGDVIQAIVDEKRAA